MLESALVVVLGFIAWLILQGAPGGLFTRGRSPRLSKQEPIRFSLKTLLIGTTLVAVGLGAMMWMTR